MRKNKIIIGSVFSYQEFNKILPIDKRAYLNLQNSECGFDSEDIIKNWNEYNDPLKISVYEIGYKDRYILGLSLDHLDPEMKVCEIEPYIKHEIKRLMGIEVEKLSVIEESMINGYISAVYFCGKYMSSSDEE